MPILKNPDAYGDLFVKVGVRIPRNLTAEQIELVKKLKALSE
jgi:DnaJ-class molecular chaperone